MTSICDSDLPVLSQAVSQVSLEFAPSSPLIFKVTFGGSRAERDAQTLEYYVTAAGERDAAALSSGVQLPVRFGPLERIKPAYTAPKVGVFDHLAEVRTDGRVLLTVCIDPTELPAGEYQTSVWVDADRITHQPVPMTFTLRDSGALQMFGMLFASWVVGGLLIALGEIKDRNWVRAATLILVGVIASVVASQTLLFTDADFGASGSDYVTLLVGSLAAFLTGTGLVGPGLAVFQWASQRGKPTTDQVGGSG